MRVCRNFVCALLAFGLIATGRVRRARKAAFAENTITSIYFHKPNKRLFRLCVGWLKRHGYTFISADELWESLYQRKPLPRGAVWLSFDDGCRELLENVLPLVRRERIPVTLFIPSGIVEGDGLYPWVSPRERRKGGRDSLTAAELKEVALMADVTIGSHSVSHAWMPNCADDDLRIETGVSKLALEALTHAPVYYFAYPYGEFSGREREPLVQFGYKLAATTENAFVTPRTDLYRVPRFSVGNHIWFPEAICNMVGEWGPVIKRLKGALAAIRGARTEARPQIQGPRTAATGE